MNTEAVTIPGPVRSVGLEAAWELAAILQHIITLCPVVDEDATPLVVRGMLLRAASLTSVLMSMMGDDMPEETKGIRALQRLVLGDAAVAELVDDADASVSNGSTAS